jgi:hypothetical protein
MSFPELDYSYLAAINSVRAGNAILFAIMTFTCLTGSLVVNRFGYRTALVFGTMGYVIYSASLYTSSRYGAVWFVYLGSAACGISAGIFLGD